MDRRCALFVTLLPSLIACGPEVASEPPRLSPLLAHVALIEPASQWERPTEPAEWAASASVRRCRRQPPQTWLMRSHYLPQPNASVADVERYKLQHRAAVEYRTRRYGLVEGHGDPAWSDREPRELAAEGSFFGIPLRLNAQVLVALGCVEAAIVEQCAATPYQPELLSGLRRHNTFNDGEVSNHVFGIAIDIDPHRNPCCGCVPPLSDWPICKRPASARERTQLPACWIASFEQYGFYWLGHDPIQDTMHFEFLGDPDLIEIRAAG